MKLRQLSDANHPIVFLMVDSADHVTGKTGLTVTVTLSKNGAAFGAASGAVSELSNGWYALAGNATDRNTLGALAIHASASGADPTDEQYTVVAFDPFAATNLGLTDLDTAISSRATQTSVNAIPTAPLLAASYTAPDNAGVAAIKAKTDNLPADPASNTQVATRLATAGYTAPDNTGIAAIQAKTDNLPAAPAATGDIPGGVQSGLTAQGYTSARAAFLDTLNGLVTAIWAAASRTLTAFGFTVNATADPDVAAIKAKTDNLPANPASQTNLDIAVSTRSSHTPADVWASPTRTLTVSGGGATAQEVWEYSTRTLTGGGEGGAATPADVEASTAAITALLTTQADIVAAVTSGQITQYRGDAWVLPITGLGNITGYASLDFAIKDAANSTDQEAMLWVRKTSSGTSEGLLRLNGEAGIANKASITIDDATLGNITIRVTGDVTAALRVGPKYFYGVQVITGTSPTTLREAGFTIASDTVRSVS
jgi:hypothetical protein